MLLWMLVLVAVPALCVNAQSSWTECSKETRNTCRKNIEDVLMGNGNTQKLELEDQCWRIRQNFDCMQWQTSMCMKREDQDENSDIILKAWRFLEGFCEQFKNWWTKSCFQTERLRRCENRLNSKGRSTDADSCRAYLSFRSCASAAVEQDCSTDDHRLLGVYLMDRGQQKSWMCPKDDDRVSSYEARRTSDSREINPDELMYSDSFSSLGACAFDIEKSVKTCNLQFTSAKETAKHALDDDTRKEKMCCAFVTLKHCIMDHLKEKCGDIGTREAKKFVDNMKSTLDFNCDDYDESTCSSSAIVTITSALLAVAVVLSFVVSSIAVNAI